MTKEQRIFLLLANDEYSKILKEILKSPLGLAKDLVTKLINNDYEELVQELDIIKQFVAGVKRADILSSEYKLAEFYPKMFAFHQFFNSSFRARQGKVLESILQTVLSEYAKVPMVPRKPKDRKETIGNIFSVKKTINLDIDVLGINNKKKEAIMIQLRSRDDTGGTTAKGSLVDLLREILRKELQTQYNITYLIAVWDARNSEQKKSTISKVYSSLKDYLSLEEEEFKEHISAGVFLSDKIKIKLAYGTNEISDSIYEWEGSKNKKIKKAIGELSKKLEMWDDLWLSYAISSVEMEINSFYGKNNLQILEGYLDKLGILLDNKDIHEKVIEKVSLKIAKIWKEPTLPFRSISDNILYIRDILYLKYIYNKYNNL